MGDLGRLWRPEDLQMHPLLIVQVLGKHQGTAPSSESSELRAIFYPKEATHQDVLEVPLQTAVKGSRSTPTPPMVGGEETSASEGLGRY